MQASNFDKIRRTSDSFENSSVIQRKIWQFYRTVILRKNLHQRCAERFAPCIRSVTGQSIAHRNTVPSPGRHACRRGGIRPVTMAPQPCLSPCFTRIQNKYGCGTEPK
ncbi:hypothetical protein THS27_11005 [Thalassospira sp. MCCC 1A01428]|nr:hypothetical protein THS27_11005 [Thalassospira sp. MCCC 1A01428]